MTTLFLIWSLIVRKITRECYYFTTQSQDKKVDKYGRRLIDLCRSLELFIVNGRVGNDKNVGISTCSNSVIDYAIVSPTLFRSIIDFNVLPFDPILSDIHKPICLQLCTNLIDVLNANVYSDIDDTNDSNVVITDQDEIIIKPRWVRERAAIFTESLDDAKNR